ncbi:gliding motility lipoprotein GldH [Nonlabens agnitus]|uniref:Gliding motility lipoprotein GldH n=1 Tax=Nonlabens agnitus TaxID=870484 RepID=A0A2S9WWQ9_9FLAO|nr:gliding motility lipoprotein GldH [Nonlabens agnitus]PRP67893.1 gliding motility lipoprotein GldH [Nonlabens agnitus]
MNLVRRLAFGLLAIPVIIGCDDNLVATDSKSFDGASWPASEPAQFLIEPVDTVTDFQIYLNMRNNKSYAYKNLWLITQMKFPQGKIVTDTLEYAMADARGAFLGTGSDVVENKLIYKKEFRFRESGTYQLTLQQAMRKSGSAQPLEQLEGVLDVGYTIEKEIQNGSK